MRFRSGWWHEFYWEHRDTRGHLLAGGLIPNTVTLEGELLKLDVFYRGVSPPLRFFVGLTGSDLTRTSTLAQVASSEPSGASGLGYERQSLTRGVTDFPTVEDVVISEGDVQVVHKRIKSRQMIFRNTAQPGGANWSGVKNMFILARMSEVPVMDKLLGFATLESAPVILSAQSTITVEVRAIEGTLRSGI
jgi:hypothetical protein